MTSGQIEAAQPKFACPACGGEAVWNPAKAKLVCPFCGTESPARLAADGAIVEHDLAAALRAIPDAARGWRADTRAGALPELQRDLGARSLAPGAELRILRLRAARPVRRDEAGVPAGKRAAVPAFAKPKRATASARGTAGCGSRRRALKRRALTDTVRGVYLPYWTFDAQVEADWTAEAGHYYYETETYVVNGQTRTRQVQRIRWEPAAGHVSHFFDDDLVCASVGVQPALVRGIEPFPTHELKPYDAGLRRRLGRRALPDRPRRRGAARARGDGREAAGAVRAADTRRHVPQPRRATPIIRSRRSSTCWRRSGC